MNPIAILFMIQVFIICLILLNNLTPKKQLNLSFIHERLSENLELSQDISLNTESEEEDRTKVYPSTNKRKKRGNNPFKVKRKMKIVYDAKNESKKCKHRYKEHKIHWVNGIFKIPEAIYTRLKTIRIITDPIIKLNEKLSVVFEKFKLSKLTFLSLLKKKREFLSRLRSGNTDKSFNEIIPDRITKLDRPIESSYLMKLIANRKTERLIKKKLYRYNFLIRKSRGVQPLPIVFEAKNE